MTIAAIDASATERASQTRDHLRPGTGRALVLVVIGAAVLASLLTVGPAEAAKATSDAGTDLTRLLRFMAVLKAAIAVCAIVTVLWRLGSPVTPLRLAAYALACAAMAAGPMLVWTMAHVGVGALVLHGGLIAGILMLWRDPAMAERLTSTVAARRAWRR